MPSTTRYIVPVLFLAHLFLSGCGPAKYVVITDQSRVQFSNGDQFYICLKAEEAQRVKSIIMLETRSAVRAYRHSRPSNPDLLEELLYSILTGEYALAGNQLENMRDKVPSYLRRLLEADFARENRKERAAPGSLVRMYQAALDEQGCALNRDIINMRIRQVRYSR